MAEVAQHLQQQQQQPQQQQRGSSQQQRHCACACQARLQLATATHHISESFVEGDAKHRRLLLTVGGERRCGAIASSPGSTLLLLPDLL
jgi:hypothetical protein